jgi:hypothetical protein
MKKERVLFLIVLFVAWQAAAQQQTNAVATTSVSHTNAPSASTTLKAPKPTFHWFGPAAPVQTRGNPRYIGGWDTHAWTTVAEIDSRRTAFPDARTHPAGLHLLWWGSEPRPK